MEQKPANIIYGVNDIPPFRTTLLLSVQHAILALVFIVYPLMLVSESGGTQLDAEGVVTASILAMAVGTFLQCLGRKGMGSGYLAVNLTTPIYLPVSIQAAKIGGLGLTFGMTVIAGIFSIVFSRFLKYFRHLFPAEVCGVAVVMLGISMVGPAVRRFLGLHGNIYVDPYAFAVAFITLSLMVARVHTLPMHIIWLCHINDEMQLAVSGKATHAIWAYMDYKWLCSVDTTGKTNDYQLRTVPFRGADWLGGRSDMFSQFDPIIPSFKCVAEILGLPAQPVSPALPGYPDGASYK